MRLVAEYTTEPFVGEDEPPQHATAAFEAAKSAGLRCDFGPLGTAVSGESDVLLPAMSDILTAAFEAGAMRVTLQVEQGGEGA